MNGDEETAPAMGASALERELSQLTKRQLRRRAESSGVEPKEIKEAQRGSTPLADLRRLIIAAEMPGAEPAADAGGAEPPGPKPAAPSAKAGEGAHVVFALKSE